MRCSERNSRKKSIKNFKNIVDTRQNGITLIALVITIIVLLILAGISIMMLAGENGILAQATKSREKNSHSSVYEAMELEYNAYIIETTTNETQKDLIGYLQDKNIIGEKLEDESYLINVSNLVGNNLSLGKGTNGTNDVYKLEEDTTATVTTGKNYKVVYYGNTEGDKEILGILSDGSNYGDNNVQVSETDEDDNIQVAEPDEDDLNDNYSKYLEQAEKNGQENETNIGIDEDGNIINLDLWYYLKINDGEAMSLGGYDSSTSSPGYNNENIKDGKIQGTVPKYIYIAGEKKLYTVTAMIATFKWCYDLKEAPEIPSSVTDMRETFYNCTSLIQAPKIPSGVTNIGYAFDNCTRLIQAPEIPSSVTKMSGTFYYCISLTQAPDIPSSVEYMYGTFEGCTSLTGTITINANPTEYRYCFYRTEKTITLNGESTMLSELAGTSYNNNVSFSVE